MSGSLHHENYSIPSRRGDVKVATTGVLFKKLLLKILQYLQKKTPVLELLY